MKNCIGFTSKTFLKMAGGRMDTPYPTPLDPPLAISYGNHQKSLAYFSHLAPLVLFLCAKRHSQKGGPWHNAPLPLNTLLRPHISFFSLTFSAEL